MSNLYTIEVTDTFGGESNYSLVNRYLVCASSFRGAINKLAKSEGSGWRVNFNSGDMARYDLKDACVCAFVSWVDSFDAEDFCKGRNVKHIGFKD